MVAIISGTQLGLFNTSATSLGSASVGPGSPGRNGESIAVNVATGNLIVQDSDDRLAALGLDLALVRTYNSLGVVDGDNNDNWRIGIYQRLSNLTGTRNASGSTITKTFGDGTDVVYTWNTTRSRYESTVGDGAHDFLTWSSTTSRWTWTDGSGRNTETYDWTGSGSSAVGKLLNSKDTDGNTITYSYAGTLLTSITDASGQQTFLDYSSNNLTQIRVVSSGVTQTLTRYRYDTSNRLRQVIVDLTPADNTAPLPDANGDGLIETTNGQTYITTYSYVGTTKQIASITQSDGSSVSFTYTTLNGQSRLATVVVNDGTVNRTTTFGYTLFSSANGGVYQTTNVTDHLGRMTTYNHDTSGRLTSVLSPTTGGSRIQTNYGYDSSGNLTTITEDPSGLNRVTTNTYDANGNLLTSRDSAGNTVSRTYDANNQLLTETQYLVRDPDGAGTGQPSSPLTTHYVYDAESHLRFVISPDGRVTEHQYDAPGKRTLTRRFQGGLYTSTTFTESALSSWAGSQNLTKLERLDYAYDFRAQVSSITAWGATTSAGAGSGTPSITRFTYDQRGQLLNTTEARGEATTGDATDFVTSYTYDGLGRVLSKTEWMAAGQTRVTTNQYDDIGNRTVTTAGSLTTTSTYNKAGELTSVVNSGTGVTTGTTTYQYDDLNRLLAVTDPTGIKFYNVYDESGRKTGEVDGTGTLTEYVYNKADQVVKTIRYATAVSSTALTSLAGNTGTLLVGAIRPATSANDQITRAVYNNAGQLQYTIDPIGAVTESVYDGAGRETDTIEYANPVSIAAATGEVLPGSFTITADAANDRRTRYFYGNDGQLLGTLDAAGYLTEMMYDAAGHLTQTTAYANQTASNVRVSGTLAQLKSSAGTDNETTIDPERDATTYFFYDGQGRQTGSLDAEGYLTETVYDVAGNVSQSIRYDAILAYSAGATLASLKGAVPAAAVRHSSSFLYNGLGQLTQETNFEGTTTTYQYDNRGNLISRTAAQGTSEARTAQVRYNAFGQVTQEMSAEGTVALGALGASPTQAQIDQVWDRYGIKYTYDAAGRKTSITTVAFDPSNGTTQTTTSFLYYDNDGQLRFTVNARGEVTESRYNTLGQVTDALTYANRISTTGLTGGLLTSALITQLTPAADANHDAKVTYTYTLTGQVASTTTAEGANTTYQYNAFGEVKSQSEKIDATRTRTTTSTYDTRGLLTSARTDTTGFNLLTSQTYDAFGRLTSATDAMGRISKIEYDRLGRTIATVDTLTNRRTMTYDAFDRVLTKRDAFNNPTTYSYNDTTRVMTVTTPEGVSVTTTKNRHGDVLSVAAAGNTTTYQYNTNGQVTSISDSLGTLESRAYDSSGRQVTQTDGKGAVTRFGYDAANRVVTRTVDPSGLNLTTTYTFDGQGRVTQVQEPTGKITETDYDNDGRVIQVAIDPAGLNLRTTFTYDLENRTVTMVEGAGSTNPRTTQYIYDTLGRRTQEVVDPGTGKLNLTTQYKYDNNGNVTRRIDARGVSTWYVYDNANRLTVTVQGSGTSVTDPKGTVTQVTYDAEGRVTATRTYFTQIDTSTFSGANSLVAGNASGLLTLQGTGSPVGVAIVGQSDRLDVTVYDKDGRAVYSIDAMGGVIQRTFDDLGNVTRSRAYPVRVPVSATAYLNPAAVQTALTNARNNPDDGARNDINRVSPNDRVSYAAYDARGRLTFSVDSAGSVTQTQYDLSNNVIATTRYAAIYNMDPAIDPATLKSTLLGTLNTWLGSTPSGQTTTVATNPKNQTIRFWYDAADRNRFTLDGEGFLSEVRYNDAIRDTRMIVYSKKDANNVPVKPSIPAGATLAQVASAAAAVASANQDEVTITVNDAAGRVSTVTDPTGGVTRYVYDATGNATTITNANNNQTVQTFDAAGRLLTSTSPGGVKLTYTYDALGNMLTAVRAFSDGSDSRTTSFIYDALNRQTRVTDGEGYSTTFVYDTFGNKTSVTTGQYLLTSGQPGYDANKANRALNLNATAVFDRLGEATTTTDASGNRTDIVFDTFGNQTSVTVAANGLNGTAPRTTTFTYDNVNRVTKVITPMGGETRYGYDALGNRTSEQILQSAANTNGVINRDASGNPVSPIWITHTFEYNKRNQLSATIDSYSTRNELYYDASGNVLEQRSAAGTSDQRSVKFEYDRNGRKSADIDGLGNRTAYGYDAVGNLTMVTKPADATGQIAIARYYYNKDNQLTTVLDPEGAINTFAYDSAGNKTTERVYLTKYTGTISDTVAPTPTASSADRIVTSTYDRNSNLATKTRSEGTTAAPTTVRTDYVYDGVGRLLSQTDFANQALPRQTTFTYFPSGKVQQITVKGDTVTGDNVTTYTYDAVGNTKTKTVTNAKDTANPVRQTAYTYDLENRLLTETIDPAGLNIIHTNKYDAAGNVIHTEVNATVITGGVPKHDYTYDLNNLMLTDFDGMRSQPITYIYDKVGNRTRVIDARGFQTDYVYDLNNRLKQTMLPTVNVYTFATGALTAVRPTTTNTYDNAGNLVQITDANGFKTTRYYDKNGRLTAELAHDDGVNYNANGTVMSDTDGDVGLCTYAYNTAGEVITKVEYMQRLSASAQNIAVRPGAPTGGEVRTTTYAYDLAGRLVQATLPAIEVTTLLNPEGETPSATKATVALTERHVYNVYGDEVETYDRGGKRTVHYYDLWHREVAAVDPMGYLTEWDYDAVGNKTAQRVYTQILNAASVSPNARPAAPTGTVHLTNWTYDAASRLTAEVAPLIDADVYSTETQSYNSAQVRRVTTYLYDNANNLRRKTIAAGQPNEQSEYYYYDGANRQVFMIDKNRVVSETQYDAADNITLKRRYYGTVNTGVNLLSFESTGSILSSLVNANSALDQIHTYTYDAANRQKTETDQVQPGTTADDVVTSYEYDANGNRTRQIDGDGYYTWLHYDADGHVLKMIDANQTGTIFEYDVAGNLLRAYTGQSSNQAAAPSNIGAKIQGGQLVLNWNVTAGTTQTFAFYDTVSHPGLVGYPNVSGAEITNGAGPVNTTISMTGLAGRTIYFRVVTQDAAGNQTWSPEEVVTVPAATNQAAAATNITVQLVNGDLKVNWTAGTGTAQSWVVYDNVSRANINDYLNHTNPPVAGTGAFNAILPASGTTCFFRVVTKDAAGNLAWTAEQKVNPPVQLISVTVDDSGDKATVRARFSGAATAELLYGTPGNLTTVVPFTLQASGEYAATTPTTVNSSSVSAPHYVYAIRWNDGMGNLRTSAEVPFEGSAGADRMAVLTTTFQSPAAANTYTLQARVEIAATSAPFTGLQAFWRLKGATTYTSSALTAATRLDGNNYYNLTFGSTGFAPGTYEIEIRGVRADGTSLTLDAYEYALSGVTTPPLTQIAMSWVAPSGADVGPDVALWSAERGVFGGEMPAPTRASDGRLVAHWLAAPGESPEVGDLGWRRELEVGYGVRTSTPSSVTVTSSTPQASTTTLTFTVTMDPQEAAHISSAGLRIRLYIANQPDAGASVIATATATPGVYTATFANRPTSPTVLQFYYVDYSDAQGRNFLVPKWSGIPIDLANPTTSGYSFAQDIVPGEENYAAEWWSFVRRLPDGLNGLGTLSIDSGFYDGNIDISRLFASAATTNLATPATNIQARSEGTQLAFDWNTGSGTARTWVVYDTVSHASMTGYANATASQLASGSGHVAIVDPAAGTNVYFRIVSQDAAGNLAWSEERRVTIPTRLSAFRQLNAVEDGTSGNYRRFSASFDGPVTNVSISEYDAAGTLISTTPFSAQADGSYLTTSIFVRDAESYVMRWSDTAGNNYTTALSSHHDSSVNPIAATTTTAQGSNGTITVQMTLADFDAARFMGLKAQWRPAGSSGAYAETFMSARATANGFSTFQLILGSGAPLSDGTYEILLTGLRADGRALTLESYTYTIGAGNPGPVKQTALSADLHTPSGTQPQVWAGDVQPSAFVTGPDGRLVTRPTLTPGGASTRVLLSNKAYSATAATLTATTVTPGASQSDVILQLTIGAADVANIGIGGIKASWYDMRIGGLRYYNFAPTATPGVYTVTIPAIPAGTSFLYFVASYIDKQNHDVAGPIVRYGSGSITTPGGSTTALLETTYSRSVGPDILLGADGILRYSGSLRNPWADGDFDVAKLAPSAPLATVVSNAATGTQAKPVLLPASGNLTVTSSGQPGGSQVVGLGPDTVLTVTASGQPGGSQALDAFATGFSQTSIYNALNDKIATNENDGLWRQFGIDASGNTVQTDLYGRQTNGLAITSYDAFDLRDRHVAHFDPFVANANGFQQRPIERYTYDVFDNRTSRMDAEKYTWLYEYNAAGNLIKETDPLFGVLQHKVDILGHETRTISKRGFTTTKFYDAQGRMIRERDAENFDTGYGYDFFDRLVTKTDARGMATATAGDYMTTYTYDNRDRLVQQQDGMGYISTFQYDKRDHRTRVTAAGQTITYAYDAKGNLYLQNSTLNGQATQIQYFYDAYGDLIGQRDAMGRSRSTTYGQFGRVIRESDEDDNVVVYEYDNYGRVIREYSTQGPETKGKDIRRYYDDAGRLTLIEDRATGVNTAYTYLLTGLRKTENTTTPALAVPYNVYVNGGGGQTTIHTDARTHNRSITYAYDAAGQLTYWVDGVTHANTNYAYDADGNRTRAYTDYGWNPVNGDRLTGSYMDDTYEFDKAGRLKTVTNVLYNAKTHQFETTVSQYNTDGAGNRKSQAITTHDPVTGNPITKVWTYTFDANNRPTQATSGSEVQTWQYDTGGRVLQFKHMNGATIVRQTDSTYYETGQVKTATTVEQGQPNNASTYTYDLSGRLTNLHVVDGTLTADYVYTYYGDGREKTITSSGQTDYVYSVYDVNTNAPTDWHVTQTLTGLVTTELYDVNKVKKSVASGQGNGQTRPKLLTFLADNEGHILFKHEDDGASRDNSNRARYAQIEYLYANGQAVGEMGLLASGNAEAQFDQGAYSLVDTIGADHPGMEQRYTVRAGDTLQSIAAAVYGNPSLWYVIADANGLSGSSAPAAGTELRIPDTVQAGALTAQNFAVYNDANIVGNVLPNLKTPVPRQDHCAMVSAIIISIVISVAFGIATSGAASALAIAVAQAGVSGGVGLTAVTGVLAGAAGAAFGAASVLASVGLNNLLAGKTSLSGNELDSLGNSVLSGAIGGLFGGAATGVGTIANAAAKVGTSFTWAPVAEGVLQASGSFLGQYAARGRVSDVSWSGVASAFIGGVVGGYAGMQAGRAFAAARAGYAGAADAYTRSAAVLQGIGYLNASVSPFVAMAETGVTDVGVVSAMINAAVQGALLATTTMWDEKSSRGLNGLDVRYAPLALDGQQGSSPEPRTTINVYAGAPGDGPTSLADGKLADSALSDSDFVKMIGRMATGEFDRAAGQWIDKNIVSEPTSITAMSVARALVKGPIEGLYDFWLQPLLGMADVARLDVANAGTQLGFRPTEPKMWSNIGKRIQAGNPTRFHFGSGPAPQAGIWETLWSAIPILNLPLAIFDMAVAAVRGDANTMVEMMASTGVAYTRLGQGINKFVESRLTGVPFQPRAPFPLNKVWNHPWVEGMTLSGREPAWASKLSKDMAALEVRLRVRKSLADAVQANDNAAAVDAIYQRGIGATPAINIRSRRVSQFDDLLGKTVDTHMHTEGLGVQGYNRMDQGGMSLRDFLETSTERNLFWAGQIPQGFERCCPASGYYLGKILSENGENVNGLGVYITSEGMVEVPDRVAYKAKGEVISVPAGTYRPERFGINSRTLSENNLVPASGKRFVNAWILPDHRLGFEGDFRQADMIDAVWGLPDELKARVAVGLTNMDPANPGSRFQLLDALAYLENMDPHQDISVYGSGEITVYKEATMSMLGDEHRFGWNEYRSQGLRNYLDYVNKNMPGWVSTIHMDAGLPLEVRLSGRSDGLLLEAETKYTNVKNFIQLVNDYPNVNFVWAHGGGLSRSGLPASTHVSMLGDAFRSVKHGNLYIDLSWDVVAEHVTHPSQLNLWAGPDRRTGIMNQFPDRFLFGSDAVAPKSIAQYRTTLDVYEKSGLLQNLRYPDAFLGENARSLATQGIQAVRLFRTGNRELLRARPLPAPWRLPNGK